jgi:SIR2-like domain
MLLSAAMSGPEINKIRRLLREAGESAELIGDEPIREPSGAGYFSVADEGGLEDAIDAIADHQGDITMFVGAGVSTGSELPSWNDLVRALLSNAEIATELSDEDRELWIQATIAQGPLAAAAIARAHHPDELSFRRALRAALYDGRSPEEFFPGALARQIAWLKQKLGSRLRLVTANYDGLLEAALEDTDMTPVAYVQNRKEPVGKAAVWHLHGRLMKSQSGEWMGVGRLVLTEGNYADSAHSSWPEDFVADCLRDTLCVFVGLSMTDPNFIRWLSRYSNQECQHLAVLVRQASVVANDAGG